MTCQECSSDDYSESPVDGICVVCAARDWRTCRTELTGIKSGIITGIRGGVEDCERVFKPEFMYQMYCESCWEKISSKRSRLMELLPDELADSLEEQTFERECVVCSSEFTTDRKGHYLCDHCQHTWLSCSGKCSIYFRPYRKRFSESYCYKCRKGKSYSISDLFDRIIRNIDVELHFNKNYKYKG